MHPGPEVALDVSKLRATVDPPQEWAEIDRNAWRLDHDVFRSPLMAPGLCLKDGDLLLALNGRELRAPDSPDALLVGVSGTVTLTVAASEQGENRTVQVAPLADEEALRRFDQTVRSRALVDRLSGGRVG